MTERRERRLRNRHIKEDETTQDIGLAQCLKTYEGRRFVWGLIAEAGVFQNPFAGNALDTAFRCGNMNAGQSLLARVLDKHPESFLTMQKENQLREETFAEKLAEEQKDDSDVV